MALVLRFMKAPATLLLTTALLSSLCITGCGQSDSGDGGGSETTPASETEAGSGGGSESTEEAAE